MRAVGSLKPDPAFAFVLLAVVCFVVLPLSFMQVPLGHDLLFHMERISCLSNELRAGILFPRIYSTALDGNGYASPMFYGDLLLRVPAVLALLGTSIPAAYKIFLVIISLSSAIASYCCFRSISADRTAAGVGAVLFSLSSYFGTDIIERSAIGEAQIFIFLPVAFAGYHHTVFGDRRKWLLLPAGLFGMLQSHMLSAAIFVMLLAAITLCRVHHVVKSPSRLKYIGWSAGVFFVLSAYFIFPFIEQISSNTFLATDGTSAGLGGTLAQTAMPWWSVFSVYAKRSPWVPNGAGLTLATVWIGYLVLARHKKEKEVLFFLVISTVLFVVTTELFPWGYFQSAFGVLQFPWRLLIFATFSMSLTAVFLVAHASRCRAKSIFVSALVAGSLFSFLMTVGERYSSMIRASARGRLVEYHYKNQIGGGEYLPSGTDVNKLLGLAESVTPSNNGMTISYARSHGKIDVSVFDNDGVDEYLELPLIAYKGYSAIAEDGTNMRVSTGADNRIRVLLGDAKSASFKVSYAGTSVQRISNFVSMAGFLCVLGYFFWIRGSCGRGQAEPSRPR